jgi:predicted enzyme related to lactoylglutathione lyase
MPWLELHTQQTEEACAFYSQVAGWTCKPEDMGGYNDYHAMAEGVEDAAAGIITSKGPSMWIPYLIVTEIEMVLKKATELGADVKTPLTDLGSWGHYCIITDPFGATIALYQPRS